MVGFDQAAMDRSSSYGCFCGIRCGACGYEGVYEDFCRTPIFGELPNNEFQCPSCATRVVRHFGRIERVGSYL